ncbi:MAG: hypothetical protein WBQ18_20130 [Solirubrobacteraceae bacterium]
MLILPPGHAQAVRQRRPFTGRERWLIRGMLAVIVAGLVVLGVSLATADKQSGHGCISVSLAYSTGGSQIYRCGAAAQAMCDGVNRPGGLTGLPAHTVADACRKAGLRIH